MYTYLMGFFSLHPWILTWNLKRCPWKRWFLLETIIFRFHVKFRGSRGLIISGQIIATSHEFSPQKVAKEDKIPLFQGNIGWWNIVNCPDYMSTEKKTWLCFGVKGNSTIFDKSSTFKRATPHVLLLMEEIPNNHLGCFWNFVNYGDNLPTSTGLPDFWTINSITKHFRYLKWRNPHLSF